ncbi:serpentine type 7TM GPCR chemoreceptor srh domain-containing protein [Ditylenchus destructor]|nr:serpentine type 7TM GPCR chemoreceptor srh domain-containing protein [Ditylenchus destructor]
MLSKRTASLYWALINSLVLDMFMSGVLAIVPILVTIIVFLQKSPFASAVATVGLQIGSIYPLVANVILIIYVTPYRKATLKLLRPWYYSNVTTKTYSLTVIR